MGMLEQWALLALAAGAWMGRVEPYRLPTPHAGNVINVKLHGARGDGESDDTAAIRTAIAAARALVKDSDPKYPAPHYGIRVLYFPAGVYVVSDTLQLYENVTISPNGTVDPPWFFRTSLELIVMGESAGSTAVQLAPRSPGFSDPNSPRPLFLTFPAGHHNDGQWRSRRN